MNAFKTLAATLALTAPLLLAAQAQAQTAGGHAGMAGMDMPGMKMQGTDPMPMTEGEVRRIDTANQKITLKHGDIKNLGMPGMTMSFKLADPALLGKLQVGDKVRFTAMKADGALVVTALEAVQ